MFLSGYLVRRTTARRRAALRALPGAVAAALLLVGVGPRRAQAGEAGEERGRAQTMSAYLGTPAHPQRLKLLMDYATSTAEQDRVMLAEALGSSGGFATLEPLARLLSDHRESVRIAAIRGIVRVRLRNDRVLARLRRFVPRASAREKRSIVVALGKLGDVQDVPWLLSVAGDSEGGLAPVAFGALRALTGKDLPNAHARWAQWARTRIPNLRSALATALAGVTHAPSVSAAAANLRTIRELAWLDPTRVEDQLERWLATPKGDLRLHAARLVFDLGLSVLLPPLERMLETRILPDPLARALERGLRATGLVVDPVAPLIPPTYGQWSGAPGATDTPPDSPRESR